MEPLERVTLEGSPRERGHAHGERFAADIERNVDTYLERFAYHGVSESAVRSQAEEFVPVVEAENEAYAEEMRGVADGSGVPLVDVTMLNVRYEVIYTVWKEETEAAAAGPRGEEAEPRGDRRASGTDDRREGRAADPPVDGCTSFGVLPEASADGHTYVGQNWDWLAPIADTIFLQEVRREDAPDHLVFTEAGIVGGKCGVNEHGVGLAVNGLTSPADGEHPLRKPFHVRCREVMDATRLDRALLPVVETDRACSANFVIGQAGGRTGGEVVDLETAPEDFAAVHPDDGVLTHSNHFLADHIESLTERRGPSTLYRAERLRRHLAAAAGEIDADVVAAGLRDHFGEPSSVCSHVDESLPEEEHGQTNASFVVDLDERRLLATRGPPCESEYREYRLAA